MSELSTTHREAAAIDGIERQIVSSGRWNSDHDVLRSREKELTHAHDRLAAERRRAPWARVERNYRFKGLDSEATLADLFDGRKQLIVYHHMLRPADPSPCEGCCMVADQIPHLAHLHARNTTLAFVSKAPIGEIEALKGRMGWTVPWYETTDSFNADHGVSGGFGLNVFYRDGGDIYRTYFTTGRGVETLGTVWTLLDLTPLGRQEVWEDAPGGTPQTEPYQWWRRHDEYRATASSGGSPETAEPRETMTTSIRSDNDHYAGHSPFSDPGKHAGELMRWPSDLPGLMAAVQNLLIYDVVAEPFYGVHLPPERQADIHLRHIEDILDRARQLDPTSLTEQRTPRDRVAARCNNFGLVLLAALRQRGMAARARAGFATYFKPGHHEDHWVVEYRDPESGAWRYADPQFDAVWLERLGIDHDIANVPGDRFLTAAEVWRGCRSGDIDPAATGIHHANMYGLFAVAGSLVRDIAALNKVELLPWDVWGAQPQPFCELSGDQLAYFDELADLLSRPDEQLDVVRDRYTTDKQLRVGETVFNALLQNTERLARHD